jgi:hypothetical protein
VGVSTGRRAIAKPCPAQILCAVETPIIAALSQSVKQAFSTAGRKFLDFAGVGGEKFNAATGAKAKSLFSAKLVTSLCCYLGTSLRL